MKRWNIRNIVQAVKNSLLLLLVCTVVSLPVFLTAMEWSGLAKNDSPRKAAALPEFRHRAQDDLPPKLFKEPIISVTFDDGWESIYDLMPLLQGYGIATTQYILSGTEDHLDYMSWDQIKTVQNAGHEIACHTVSHADLTALSDSELTRELGECKTVLSKRYDKIEHFASPYGAHNLKTISAIKQYYGSHRNTQGSLFDGINDADINLAASFDRYNIIAVTIRRDTSLADIQRLVNYTINRSGWLVLNYHQVDNGPSEYGLDYENISSQLDYLSQSSVRIATIGQVLDSYRTGAQLERLP